MAAPWLLRLTPILSAICLFNGAAFAQGPSAAGRWKTIDDRNGQVQSIMVIEEVGGEFRGKVDRIFSPPAKSATPLCEKCPGDREEQARPRHGDHVGTAEVGQRLQRRPHHGS